MNSSMISIITADPTSVVELSNISTTNSISTVKLTNISRPTTYLTSALELTSIGTTNLTSTVELTSIGTTNLTSTVELTSIGTTILTSALELTSIGTTNLTSTVELTTVAITNATGIQPTKETEDIWLSIFLQALGVFIGLTVLGLIVQLVRYLNFRQKKKQERRQNIISRNNPRQTTINHYEISYLSPTVLNPQLSHQTNVMTNGGYLELTISHGSFPIDRLQLLEKLGEGNSGTVHKANAWNIANQPGLSIVAVKMLKNETLPDDKESFKKEIVILQSIPRQKNIILFYGYFNSNGLYGLITEYLQNGCLHSYLVQSKDSFEIPLLQMLTFANDIAKGMAHLSFHKFIHRDLAARNILLDDNLVCKITDFGLTRQEPEEYLSLNPFVRFPTRWLAIESVELYKFSSHSDVWAFGIVLWEIFSYGSLPYPEIKTSQAVRDAILKGKKNKQPDNCPGDIFNLMKECWSRNPNYRPSFPKCLLQFKKYLENEAPYEMQPDYELPTIIGSSKLSHQIGADSSTISNDTIDYFTPLGRNEEDLCKNEDMSVLEYEIL